MNKADSTDRTPLMVSAMVDALIQKGEKVNAVHIDEYKKVRTALMYAAKADHTLCVELLLKSGANMITVQTVEHYWVITFRGCSDQKCRKLPPALEYAVRNRNKQVMDMLLDVADSDTRDKLFVRTVRGGCDDPCETPRGASSFKRECVEALVDRGADVKEAIEYSCEKIKEVNLMSICLNWRTLCR